MKQKLLLSSDWHFHNYKSHSSLIGGVNSRLLDARMCWDQSLDIAEKEDCKGILIAGDVSHVRGNIRPSVYNMISGRFYEAVYRMFDILAIAGNHDFENFHYGETSINSLSYINTGIHGVTVVTYPKIEDFLGYKVGCIPYIHDTKAFFDCYDKMITLKPDIMLIHQGVDDFASADIPRTQITVDRLSCGFDGWVFAGHYHHPGMAGGTKIVNIGAPYMQGFGDTEEKGCWVFDGDRCIFHPLDAPKFITVDHKRDAGRPIDYTGAFVRLCSHDAKRAGVFAESIKAAGAASVTVVLEKEFKTAHEKTVKLSTPRKMLADYIDLMEKYAPHKEKLLQMFDKNCIES